MPVGPRLLWLAPAAGLLAAGVWLARADEPAPPAAPAPAAAPAAGAPRGRVHVRRPAGPPRVDTGRVDARGQPVLVACGTCHATRPPDATQRAGSDLTDFHQGLRTAHGERTCLACHDARDYDRLKLADGTPLAFEDVRQLCAQCHGPQHRDWLHGAHGGMTGHWDLAAGDRTRNGCTDCHDPHAPAYPAATPVFPPRPAARAPGGPAHD